MAGVPGAYGSPFALWWQKTAGLDVEQNSDETLVMGTRLEVVIGEVWQKRHPESMLVRPGAGLFRHPTLTWLMATPDFLAVSKVDDDPWPEVSPVECKAYDGGNGWGVPGTDQVPEHVECQVLMQCEVLGARRGHVARMQGKRITGYTIDAYPANEGRRRALVDTWLQRAEMFVQSLAFQTPPPIDGSDATEAVLQHRYADLHEGERASISRTLAQRYRWALEHANDAQHNLALMRNEMRAAMGNAEFATDPDGRDVAQRRVYKRREYTVAAGMVDGVWPLAAERSAASTVDEQRG